MGEEVYKPVYVIAGKRDNDTFGVVRTRPANFVNAYFNIEDAREALMEVNNFTYEAIIVDVGAIVNQNLDRRTKVKNISKIVRKP